MWRTLVAFGESFPTERLSHEAFTHASVRGVGCVHRVDDYRQQHDCKRTQPTTERGQGVIRMKPVHLVLIGFGAVVAAKVVKGLLSGWLGLNL